MGWKKITRVITLDKTPRTKEFIISHISEEKRKKIKMEKKKTILLLIRSNKTLIKDFHLCQKHGIMHIRRNMRMIFIFPENLGSCIFIQIFSVSIWGRTRGNYWCQLLIFFSIESTSEKFSIFFRKFMGKTFKKFKNCKFLEF